MVGMVLKMAGNGSRLGRDWVRMWYVGGVDGGFLVFCKDTERCYLFVVVYIT